MTILSKPLLDPIFDVEPVFEVRFDSKSRLEGVLVKTLRTFQATPVERVPVGRGVGVGVGLRCKEAHRSEGA